MTVRDGHASMHACVDGEVVASVERDDLRTVRAHGARAIREAWTRAQVVIRDALSPHIAEVQAAIWAVWPFSGESFATAAARLGAGLVATPIRAVVTTAVVAVISLIVLAAHAAN
jgi:hypothetical protein